MVYLVALKLAVKVHVCLEKAITCIALIKPSLRD